MSDLTELGQEAIAVVSRGVADGAPLVKCQLLASAFYEALRHELRQADAPDAAVTPVVMYDDEKIQRHEDCPGVGRVRWYVRYVLPAADSSARALKPILDAAMVRWQQRYDLGVNCEAAA